MSRRASDRSDSPEQSKLERPPKIHHPEAWTLWKVGKRYVVVRPGASIRGKLIHEVATREDAERLRADYMEETVIATLGPEEIILTRQRPRKLHRGRATEAHYPCGHPRTPENSRKRGEKFRYIECRECDRERIRNWNKEHPKRLKRSRRRWNARNPEYPRQRYLQHHLAQLLYGQMRALMIRDGCWESVARGRRPGRELSAA